MAMDDELSAVAVLWVCLASDATPLGLNRGVCLVSGAQV